MLMVTWNIIHAAHETTPPKSSMEPKTVLLALELYAFILNLSILIAGPLYNVITIAPPIEIIMPRTFACPLLLLILTFSILKESQLNKHDQGIKSNLVKLNRIPNWKFKDGNCNWRNLLRSNFYLRLVAITKVKRSPFNVRTLMQEMLQDVLYFSIYCFTERTIKFWFWIIFRLRFEGIKAVTCICWAILEWHGLMSSLVDKS